MDLPVKEVDSLLLLLSERKQELELEEAESNLEVLLEFLHRSQLRKQEELYKVSDLCISYLFRVVFSGMPDVQNWRFSE